MVPAITIVIPLYNEEDVLPLLIGRLKQIILGFSEPIEVVLIDDGSKDNTSYIIQQLALSNKIFKSVILSRNFGHSAAISAGLSVAKGTKALFIIDGDLQDPPELLTVFYSYFNEGYDVIYGVRKNRKENAFKKSAYHAFYRLLNWISHIDIPIDSGDFCMISRRAADVLNSMPEESRYLRGMRSWIGFRQIGIPYDRDARMAGFSKYSLRKLIQLALNGIFNFSEVPIKLIFRIGFGAILLATTYLFYAVYQKFVHHQSPQGFTGLLFAIVLFSGVQLLSLAVIGEYVVRIFFQTKQRPLFIIKNLFSSTDE